MAILLKRLGTTGQYMPPAPTAPPMPSAPTGGGGILRQLGSFFLDPLSRYTRLGAEAAQLGGRWLLDPEFRRLQSLLQKGQQITPEETQRAQQLFAPRFISPETQQRFAAPAGGALEAGKTIAGMESYFIPGGRTLKGALGLGALAGGLRGFAEPKATPESIAATAAGGGLAGGLVYGGGQTVAALQRALGRGGRGLQEVGAGARQYTLKPQVEATPFYSQEIAELQAVQESLGLRGSAKAQLEQIGQMFQNVSQQIKTKLRQPIGATKQPLSISARTVQNQLDDSLNASITFDPTIRAHATARDKIFGQISKQAKAGTVTYDNLFTIKQGLGNQLGRAWKKIAMGNPLTQQEEVGLVVYNSLKDVIDGGVPGISNLTWQEHMMFKLSKGLVERAEGGTRVWGRGAPAMTLPIPGRPIQAAADIAGRGLGRAGAALAGRFGETAAYAPGWLQRLAPQVSATIMRAPKPQPTMRAPQGPSPTMGALQAQRPAVTQQPRMSQEQLWNAIIADLAATGGKNFSTIEKVYGAGLPEVAKVPAEAQQRLYFNAESGLRALDTVEDEIDKNPFVMYQAAVPGSPGARIYKTAVNEASDVLTRLRTGAALNVYEMEFYPTQLPQAFDSPATIRYKINNLRQLYSRFVGVGGL